jgi:hypothetical protein
MRSARMRGVSQVTESGVQGPESGKAPGCFSRCKGPWFVVFARRLLTAKLTGAGPNVTILKLLTSASIDKVDGLDGAACYC